MALEIFRQKTETERVVGEEQEQILLRGEGIVPGAGRDEVHILLEDARFTLEKSQTQAGRVLIEGTVTAQALYRLGEEGEIAAISVEIPVSRGVDLPEVAPGMTCMASGRVEHAEAGYENGRMLFQIALGLRVRALSLREEEAVTGIEGGSALEKRYVDLRSVKISAEGTAQTALEGEARLPEVLDARTALMDWSSVRIDESAPDLGGLRVKGSVQAEALVGSGVAARPVALVRYSLPFDLLVEMPDWLMVNTRAEAEVTRLTTKLCQAEEGGMCLRFAAEVRARVTAYGSEELPALADAYGTGTTDVTCEYQKVRLCEGMEEKTQVENLHAELLLPEGAPSAGTVVAVRARPQIAQWEREGEGTRISGALETGALYLASGAGTLCAARGDVSFSLWLPFPMDPADWAEVSVDSADASAMMNDRLELHCAIRVVCGKRMEKEVELVSGCEETLAEKRGYGVRVYWPCAEETLWEIGRKYRVTENQLRKWNGEEAPQSGKAMIVQG